MEKVTIYKEKIPSLDPKLKRVIHHDSRSKAFAFNTSGLTLKSTLHTRFIPILDQGNVGSCTGNAGIGALGSFPLYTTAVSNTVYSLNESGAIKLYSDAEVIDGSGPYPPNDNGSSGLSIAKALKTAGLISSYQHTFTLNDALKALTQYPILVGINWYQGMFTPDKDGRVRITGGLAGGHEIIAREIDAVNSRIWFDNSWGLNWGVNGRFYLTFTDLGTLLSRQGDVVVLIPNTTPVPNTPITNTTPTQADIALASAMRSWLTEKGL